MEESPPPNQKVEGRPWRRMCTYTIQRLFPITRFSRINWMFCMVKLSLLVTPVCFFANMFVHFCDINLFLSCKLCTRFEPCLLLLEALQTQIGRPRLRCWSGDGRTYRP